MKKGLIQLNRRTHEDLEQAAPDLDRPVTFAIGLAWLGSAIWFWSWWLSSDHWVTPFGIYLTSLAIFLTFSFGAWYLLFSLRRSPGIPTALDPNLRLGAVVTKAPSEPWDVVRLTLTALLEQDYPHPYDVWLADEDPLDETLAWCAANGVLVSCRKGVEDYHQANWPRRTRCKEGNLAYFYDQHGYERYDVVAQFDADHVPEPSYLRIIAPYFNDPGVGYVAAPSICDIGSAGSWMARGRLHREASFHGSLQIKTDGLASLCIGSHYAVRTKAVQSIGGIGPELAEDFSTSFLLVSAGWKGRFAADAIAHGEGPESFADAIRQEMQWARSLVVLFLDQTRGRWGGIDRGQRLRLGFSLVYYPVFVAQMVLGMLFAPIALISDVPWVDVSFAEYLVRAGLPAGFLLALLARQKARGLLRPVDAPVVSWESLLFHIVRWPWVCIGVTQAVIGHVTNRSLDIVVTPKGTAGPKKLPLRPLLPYWILSIATSLVVIFAATSNAVGGYYIIGLFHAFVYAMVGLAITVLHARENPGLRLSSLISPICMALTAGEAVLIGAVIRIDAIAAAIRSSAFLPIPYPDAAPSEVASAFLVSLPVRVFLVGFVVLALWTHFQLRNRLFIDEPASIRHQQRARISPAERSQQTGRAVRRRPGVQRSSVLASSAGRAAILRQIDPGVALERPIHQPPAG